MGQHEMAGRMRDALEAWLNQDAEGGLDHLGTILADDVVWHMVGPEEPIRGKPAVLDALGQDMGDLTVEGEVHDVLADDEHVIGLISVTLRRGGKQASYRGTEIAHHADGKITERWAMVDDFAAMVEFWSD